MQGLVHLTMICPESSGWPSCKKVCIVLFIILSSQSTSEFFLCNKHTETLTGLRTNMTTGHSCTTQECTAPIWRSGLKITRTANDPFRLWMVLAGNGISLSNPIRLPELLHNVRPESVLALGHKSCVANEEHALLCSRQQHIRTVGRFEKPNRTRGGLVLSNGVAPHKRDKYDLRLLALRSERKGIIAVNNGGKGG